MQKCRLENKNVKNAFSIKTKYILNVWCMPTCDFINVYRRCYRISARIPARNLVTTVWTNNCQLQAPESYKGPYTISDNRVVSLEPHSRYIYVE